ncbi:MAG: hypothetical protein K2Q26_05330 [Bdellovibrionales bacterium]|nr:hypothetical protein [Bdellovibrionales bacterium]
MNSSKTSKMKWGILILFSCISKFAVANPSLISSNPSETRKATLTQNLEKTQASPKGNKAKPLVLPLMTFFDSEKGEVYNWWAENQSTGRMNQLSQWVLKNMPVAEAPVSFAPVLTSQVSLPESYKKTELTRTQMVELAKAFRAPYIVTGDIVVSKSPIVQGGTRMKVHLEIFSAHNGVRVHEVLRISELPAHMLVPRNQDMVNTSKHILIDSFTAMGEGLQQKQAETAWIDIVVNGPMSHAQLQRLKYILKTNVAGMRSMYEKVHAPEQVVWNVDYDGPGAKGLSSALAHIAPEEFFIQVAQSDAGQVLLDVKVKPK